MLFLHHNDLFASPIRCLAVLNETFRNQCLIFVSSLLALLISHSYLVCPSLAKSISSLAVVFVFRFLFRLPLPSLLFARKCLSAKTVSSRTSGTWERRGRTSHLFFRHFCRHLHFCPLSQFISFLVTLHYVCIGFSSLPLNQMFVY